MYNFARLDAVTARLAAVVSLIDNGVKRLEARIEALEAGDPAVQVLIDNAATSMEQAATALEAIGARLPITPPPGTP